MKKILLLALLLVFVLCGCKNKKEQDIPNVKVELINYDEAYQKMLDIAREIYEKEQYKDFFYEKDIYTISVEELESKYDYDFSFLNNVGGKMCNKANSSFYINLKKETPIGNHYYIHLVCE